MRKSRALLLLALPASILIGQSKAAAPAPTSTPPAAAPARAAEDDAPSLDGLYEVGKNLFDQLAPAEIKEQFEFPSKEQWDTFATRLQQALQSENPAELIAYEKEARMALSALRLFPEYQEYAEWLQERIDYIEATKDAGPTPVKPPVKPPSPKPGEPSAPAPQMPNYALWLTRMRAREVPAQAEKLMPVLRAAFVAEGVPGEIAWLAEAESTMNPSARSPAGAKGLFQLMPQTAKSLGLSTFMPDERANVEKSAQAAARYLRTLHEKFGDWPLAFAAYNAGEGRVRRLLKAKDGDSFSDIAAALPNETRMYVPKVCATIEVRAGVPPDKLAAPKAG